MFAYSYVVSQVSVGTLAGDIFEALKNIKAKAIICGFLGVSDANLLNNGKGL